MTKKEETFDKYDEMNLTELDERLDQAEIAKKAKDTALSSHGVIEFVRNLPVESITFPAISSKYQSMKGFPWCTYLKKNQEVPYIKWNMPGRDHARAAKEGCKFRFTVHSDFVSCPSEKKHYAKAKKLNCWSLTCPYCVNNTALKGGAESEHRILSFRYINIRKDLLKEEVDIEPRHWVISPPQEWGCSMIQDTDSFEHLKNIVRNELLECGMHGGAMVFHPWRQKRTQWKAGPHFHVIGYGFVDVKKFHKDMNAKDGQPWVIKLVHKGKKIKSVRHTVAYLLTHSGIGRAEVSLGNIDFHGSVLDLFIKDKKDINDFEYEQEGRHTGMPEIAASFYSYENYDHLCPFNLNVDRWDEKQKKFVVTENVHYDPYMGFIDFDWEQWTKARLMREFYSVTYFGEISKFRMRRIETIKTDEVRPCPECGSELCLFHGMKDALPEVVTYKHKTPVFAFGEDADMVRSFIHQNAFEAVTNGTGLLGVLERLPEVFTPDMIEQLPTAVSKMDPETGYAADDESTDFEDWDV